MPNRDKGAENPLKLPKLEVESIRIFNDSPQLSKPIDLVASSEAQKEDRFLEPHSADVLRDLLARIQGLPTDQDSKMILKVGNSRVFAFVIDGDPDDGEWQRVPPTLAWRDRGREFCINFVVCLDSPQSSSWFNGESGLPQEDSQDFVPSYYSMMVHTKKFALGTKFDQKELEVGYRIHKAGFPSENLAKIFDWCVDDPNVDVQGNYRRGDLSLVAFKDGNTLYRSSSDLFDVINWEYLRDSTRVRAGYLANRMALLAIDGPTVPAWFKKSEKVRGLYVRQVPILLEKIKKEGVVFLLSQ